MNQNGFTQVQNHISNNANLTLQEKGLLLVLLSNHQDWKIYKSEIENRSANGRDAHANIFHSLEQKGYIEKLYESENIRDEKTGLFAKRNGFYRLTPLARTSNWNPVTGNQELDTSNGFTETNNTNINNTNTDNIKEIKLSKQAAIEDFNKVENPKDESENWTDLIPEEILTQYPNLEPFEENAAAGAEYEYLNGNFEDRIIEIPTQQEFTPSTRKTIHSNKELSNQQMDVLLDESHITDEALRGKIKAIYNRKKETVKSSSTGFFKKLIADELAAAENRNENVDLMADFKERIRILNFSDVNDRYTITGITYKEWLLKLSEVIGVKKCLSLFHDKKNLAIMLEKKPSVLNQNTHQIAYSLGEGKSFADAIQGIQYKDPYAIGTKKI